MNKVSLIIVLLSILYGCNSAKLPIEKYNASPIGYVQEIVGDSLFVSFENLLECPVRLVLTDTSLNKSFERNGLVVLNSKEKKTVSVYLKGKKEFNSGVTYMLGKPITFLEKPKLSLPFKKGNEYTIIQGYNGNFSHNKGISKYALDFSLKIGDTICAADKGFVVGLVNKYKFSGSNNSWKDYSNFITIYNPETGLFTEYVHLKANGSLVSLGDFVNEGQPIGLSGMTGWTTVAHLHFVAYFRNKDWISEPVKVEFVEDYKGEDLKEGDTVRKM